MTTSEEFNTLEENDEQIESVVIGDSSDMINSDNNDLEDASVDEVIVDKSEITPSEEQNDIPKEELLLVFKQEFNEMMEVYKDALKELRKISGDKEKAFTDIFRVYHTLKGDAAYFEEYKNFMNFCVTKCEDLRNLTTDRYDDPKLLTEIRINYSRLSVALIAINKGRSLKTLRF